MKALDDYRDACLFCGQIQPNPEHVESLLKRVFGPGCECFPEQNRDWEDQQCL
jgi:hypothetical protein